MSVQISAPVYLDDDTKEGCHRTSNQPTHKCSCANGLQTEQFPEVMLRQLNNTDVSITVIPFHNPPDRRLFDVIQFQPIRRQNSGESDKYHVMSKTCACAHSIEVRRYAMNNQRTDGHTMGVMTHNNNDVIDAQSDVTHMRFEDAFIYGLDVLAGVVVVGLVVCMVVCLARRRLKLRTKTAVLVDQGLEAVEVFGAPNEK